MLTTHPTFEDVRSDNILFSCQIPEYSAFFEKKCKLSDGDREIGAFHLEAKEWFPSIAGN